MKFLPVAYLAFVLLGTGVLVVPDSAVAAVSSGGDYTLHGGPTAISSPASSGGSYSETGSGNAVGGASSAGDYTTTGNQPVNGSSGAGTNGGGTTTGTNTGNTTAGTSGGTSGQYGSGQGSSSGARAVLVTNVVVSRPSPTSLKVTFDTSSAVASSVSYRTGTSTMLTVTDSVSGTQHSFILPNLTLNTPYNFTILGSAADSAGPTYEFSTTLSSLTVGTGLTAPAVTVTQPLFGAGGAAPSVATVQAQATTVVATSSNTHKLSPYSWIFLIIMAFLAAIIGVVAWKKALRKAG